MIYNQEFEPKTPWIQAPKWPMYSLLQ